MRPAKVADMEHQITLQALLDQSTGGASAMLPLTAPWPDSRYSQSKRFRKSFDEAAGELSTDPER